MDKWTERLLVFGATWLLYLLFMGIAWRERGYDAVGGEFLIFLLPILYYTMKRGKQE